MHPLEEIEIERQSLLNKGVEETDLPFLLHQPRHQVGFLMLHGSAASPANHLELARELYQTGYSVYGSLFPGHGDKAPLYKGEVTWQDCFESAEKALERLLLLTPKVFVLGSSFGGSLAYLLGIKYPHILAGVIAVSAPAVSTHSRDPLNLWIREVEDAIQVVEKNIHRLSLPALILHGSDDHSVKAKNALYAYEHISSTQKKLILYNQIGHSVGFGRNTPEVKRDITQFLQAYPSPIQATFTLIDKGYQSVEVVGDFCIWEQGHHPMHLEEGVWQTSCELTPGQYQYKFVVNGQNWILDPQAGIIPNPHGEKNSLKYLS